MSVCRWSSDDFRCDLYVYSAEEGYACHVATMRHDWEPPEGGDRALLALAGKIPSEEWMDRYRHYHDALDAAPMVPVESPYAGCWWEGLEEEDLWPLIVALSESGCHVPESLLLEAKSASPGPVDERLIENLRQRANPTPAGQTAASR